MLLSLLLTGMKSINLKFTLFVVGIVMLWLMPNLSINRLLLETARNTINDMKYFEKKYMSGFFKNIVHCKIG